MGFLEGRRILVTGMLSNRSIAYGIAKACAREGAALAFTYQGEGVRDRVSALAPLADGTQHIRLLSSDDDPFLGVTRDLSEALLARHIDHDLVVTPGPHGYDFNRGPGGIELLYFHDRVLAREPM